MTGQSGGNLPQILAVNCQGLLVVAGSFGTQLVPTAVDQASPAFTVTLGNPIIQVNTIGWYQVTVRALSRIVGEDGVPYHLTDGGEFDYIAGTSPDDYQPGSSTTRIALESTGYVLFDADNHSINSKVNNLGAVDATFDCYIMALYLGES